MWSDSVAPHHQSLRNASNSQVLQEFGCYCCVVFHGGRISNQPLITPSIKYTLDRSVWIAHFAGNLSLTIMQCSLLESEPGCRLFMPIEIEPGIIIAQIALYFRLFPRLQWNMILFSSYDGNPRNYTTLIKRGSFPWT